jgi:hypothetical protein
VAAALVAQVDRGIDLFALVDAPLLPFFGLVPNEYHDARLLAIRLEAQGLIRETARLNDPYRFGCTANAIDNVVRHAQCLNPLHEIAPSNGPQGPFEHSSELINKPSS